jgi:hypothetical protein
MALCLVVVWGSFARKCTIQKELCQFRKVQEDISTSEPSISDENVNGSDKHFVDFDFSSDKNYYDVT